MALTKINRFMKNENPVTFETVSEMVASPYLTAGDYAQTSGYYTPGDGGGNLYEIVASSTGTVDGGSYINLTGVSGQAKGLFPNDVLVWDQFGAKGDGTTNDTAAMQALVDYAQSTSLVWNEDDRASNNTFPAQTKVTGVSGKIYAMESGVTIATENRNLVLDSFSVKATGSSWLASDYMFEASGGNSTYINLLNLLVNCDGKCSGIKQRSNSWSIHCQVIRASGVGIEVAGTRSYVYYPVVQQWSVFDDEFYTPSAYTAKGIYMNSDDCRLFGGEVGWNKYNVYVEGDVVNCHIVGAHLFNGMEDFASNIDINTGLTAIGRLDPNIYIAAKTTLATRPNVFIYDCYIDNGHIESYHTSVTVRNCSYHSNLLHTPSSPTAWHVFHAEQANDVFRGIIQEAEAGVKDRPRNWLDFQEAGGNTWVFDDSVIEAASWNVANASNSPFNVFGSRTEVSLDTSLGIYHGQGDKAYFEIEDKDSTQPARIGVDQDQIILETNNGSMRVEEIGGSVNFKVSSSNMLVPRNSGAPGSAQAGDIYFDTSSSKHRGYNGSTWNDLY